MNKPRMNVNVFKLSIQAREIKWLIFLFIITCLNISAKATEGTKNTDWLSLRTWVYQLCNYKNDRLDEIAESKFDLAVIDLSKDGGTSFFKEDEIHTLKASGKIVLAYFSIGSIETYRPEWAITPDDLKAGKVAGWPQEQYVRFWDERWWPIVKRRIDQAVNTGFDGAYLDMVTTYEEIPNSGMNSEMRAQKMVELIARISAYAKSKKQDFKIVPQNCPELYTWSLWKPQLNKTYINSIDGIGLENVFYLPHDQPATKDWCEENRRNALAIRKAGKLVLGVDYAKKPASIADAYNKQRALGFVPYVSVKALDRIQNHPESFK